VRESEAGGILFLFLLLVTVLQVEREVDVLSPLKLPLPSLLSLLGV
jgi:hypothetical protein